MTKFIAWLQNVVAWSGVPLPNLDQVLSWVRTSLSAIGVVVIQHGWASSTTWVLITGIVLFFAPYVWGIIAHTLSAKLAAVEAIPGVKAIEVKPTATGALAAAVADKDRPKVVEQKGPTEVKP